MKKLFTILLLSTCTFSVSNAQCDANVREAFGGISAISIYNTYITIGAIADAYVNDVYDEARVKELMDEQSTMLQAVIDMLSQCREVKDDGLTKDDVTYINDLIKCLNYLKNEAAGLNDYAQTGSEEAQTKYGENRDKAWELISELMGLE